MDTLDTTAEFLNNIIAELRLDTQALVSGMDADAAELSERILDRLTLLQNFTDLLVETCRLDIQPFPPEFPAPPVPVTPALPGEDLSGGFTPQTLALYNGQNGYPAYVAINGVVYDVTNIPTWARAAHYGLAAGKDLTPEYALCHNMREILFKLPTVGIMVFEG